MWGGNAVTSPPLVILCATWRFRRDRNKEEKTADALSLSWQESRTAGPDATGWSIANFAVRGVEQGRQFVRSEVSIDSPRCPDKPVRQFFDPAAVCRTTDDPADVVAMRLDVPKWLATLTRQQRRVALELLSGSRQVDIAEMLGVTPGRIGQYRDWLKTNWQDFTE